jgi:hypothetical protein
MHSTQKHTSTAASMSYEGLEFEITGVEEARRVLDGDLLTPTPVATAGSPAEWKPHRRETRPTDRALSGQAIDWLLSLPPGVRPKHLGTQFPRIAHALATVWDEPDACRVELGKLLAGERKGRRGFPYPVRQELVALRDLAQAA